MFRLIEPSSGDILTKLILLNYASSMDPYIVFIFVCYYILAFANHLYILRLGGCVLYCFKDVLKEHLKLIKSLKILNY
jgi:hypothetical protein